MSMAKPFLLTPVAQDYLWGGTRLNDDFGKQFSQESVAESWECSTHENGYSIVATGTFAGQTLYDVLKEHTEYLGTHPAETMEDKPGEIPILVKLLDANKDLSVQVHPGDDYAKKHENGQLGKTEMWYILQAKPGAELIYGFRKDVSEEQVRNALNSGTLNKFLQRVPVHKNDVFFLETGTVHALGKGILAAEVQESSDVTYRLFDYGRVDKHGNSRALHIDKAMEVMNFHSSAAPRQPMRVLKYKPGCASEFLCRCKYFQVERLLLNTESFKEMTDFQTESNSFHVLLCTDGCGVITGDEFLLNFFKGDCIFVPADSIPMKLHGKATILNISC